MIANDGLQVPDGKMGEPPFFHRSSAFDLLPKTRLLDGLPHTATLRASATGCVGTTRDATLGTVTINRMGAAKMATVGTDAGGGMWAAETATLRTAAL